MNVAFSLAGKSAVSIMNGMVARAEKAPDQQATITDIVHGRPAGKTKTTEELNAFYFGHQMTIEKAMFLMMEHVVGYLNEKLEVGRDGDTDAIEAGNEWRRDVLKETAAVNSEDDFSLPMPGEDDVTFAQAARIIDSKFNLSALSLDTGLMQALSDLLGFDLTGMDVEDLITAFNDPGGKSARKVREVLSEGLAGQPGSKVSQRLEDAADGPKSTEELLSEKPSPIDTVDEETLAEDQQALETARNREKLEGIEAMNDRIAETLEAAREAKEADGESKDGSALALDIIQILADQFGGTASPSEEQDAGESAAASPAEEDAGNQADAAAQAPVESDAIGDGTDADDQEYRLGALENLARAYEEDAALPNGMNDDEEDERSPLLI